MNIYLARHGQNEDNANGILNGHRDLPLTTIGVQQANQVAQLIKESGISFDHILSSPLSRAHETARIIQNHLNSPTVDILDLLIERNFGVMSGVKQEKIKDLCAPDIIETATITYFLSPKGAETFPDLIKRAENLLDYLKKTYQDTDNLLLVGHGDMGKMIYAAYYQIPWKQVLTDFHFGNSEILLLSPNSNHKESKLFTINQHNN